MAADIIREYLLALGWKIDQQSWSKYNSALAQTASATAKVGAVALETAVAIETMVTRVARQYENLYYVSQRTRQTVGFLQASQFAFRQIGLTADDAIQSIESVAATMRTQPWLRALFGGETTPQGIAARLQGSGLPYFLQARLAGMAGIDEKTLFHLEQFGETERQAAEDFRKRQREAGLDPDKLATQFTNFSRVLNKVESDFDILGDRIAADWLEPMTKAIDTVGKMVQWINRADAATQGWAGTIASLGTTAFAGWFGNKILMGVLRKLGIVSATAEAAGAGATATASGIGLGGAAVVGGLAGGILAATTVPANAPEAGRKWNVPLGPPTGGDVTERIAQAVNFFTRAGYSREAAIGIATSLFLESGRTMSPTAFNPAGGGAGAVGVGQWRGDRQAQFRKIFGKDLKDASLDEQLQYVLWEMTQGGDFGARRAGQILKGSGITASQASTAFLTQFERPGAGGAGEVAQASSLADELSRAAAGREVGGGGATVTMNQKTEINVSGASSADAASRVLAAQDRVNDGLVRTLQGAVR